MRFSERIGINPTKLIQIYSIDDDLHNSLWNAFSIYIWNKLEEKKSKSDIEDFILSLWLNFYKEPIDTIPYGYDAMEATTYGTVYLIIKKRFFQVEWYEVYEFIEFCIEFSDSKYIEITNAVLERERSGYRIIVDRVVPITDNNEIDSIEASENSEYSNVSKHIQTAVELFSDRKNPDYRNSVKESISAVEAMCNIVAGENDTTLGKALGIIERQRVIELHPSLRAAFDKLYGYTSDSKTGIRHFMLEKRKISFEDAKYMLVTCSAFVNYLKGELAKTK